MVSTTPRTHKHVGDKIFTEGSPQQRAFQVIPSQDWQTVVPLWPVTVDVLSGKRAWLRPVHRRVLTVVEYHGEQDNHVGHLYEYREIPYEELKDDVINYIDPV